MEFNYIKHIQRILSVHEDLVVMLGVHCKNVSKYDKRLRKLPLYIHAIIRFMIE